MSNKFKTISIQELPLYFYESKTRSQEQLIKLIEENEITFVKGKAGTGKTFSSLAVALQKLLNKEYEKLIIIKPLVEAEENLGYLPGTVDSKVYPYHYSTLFTIDSLIGKEERIAKMKKGDIEILPIAYLRGVTFNNTFIIVDEAQNATQGQVKLILTRIGNNSKMVFLGDTEQTDLKSNKDSGLADAIDRFDDLDNVGVFSFKKGDIVRNKIITTLLDRYD